MPLTTSAADKAAASIARSGADELRRELNELLLTPGATVAPRHLTAFDDLRLSLVAVAKATRTADKAAYAIEDLGGELVSDLAAVEHALGVLTAVHGPQSTPAT